MTADSVQIAMYALPNARFEDIIYFNVQKISKVSRKFNQKTAPDTCISDTFWF